MKTRQWSRRGALAAVLAGGWLAAGAAWAQSEALLVAAGAG